MKKSHIQLVGALGVVYSSLMSCSFTALLFSKKEALIISDSYLIDNTRYESVGKIYFNEIRNIKRIKKYSVEIVLKQPVFKLKRLNFLKKVLLFANNWNAKNSIIISSALLNSDIKKLENAIMSIPTGRG